MPRGRQHRGQKRQRRARLKREATRYSLTLRGPNKSCGALEVPPSRRPTPPSSQTSIYCQIRLWCHTRCSSAASLAPWSLAIASCCALMDLPRSTTALPGADSRSRASCWERVINKHHQVGWRVERISGVGGRRLDGWHGYLPQAVSHAG